ncbi:hypothetical protein DSO57_1011963 [Entomophthora muscae]|uniref:Uncharacterized protein n=1 Tax=Entomophthora muscae TaxID=34485 RepID=A0ACC2SUW2_9FUNG|nr:hypothetical protein DSO57_1011963 [Entomophthora muscae]
MSVMEFYVGVGVAVMAMGSILLNCLLLCVVLTIRNRKLELNFSIALAVFGIIKPAITLSTTAFVLVTNPDASLMNQACRVKGPFDFICTFANMALVAIVARLRCSTVLGKAIHTAECVAFGTFSVMYSCVIGVVGFNDLFRASPSGVDCSSSSSENISSAVLVFLLGFALLLFSVVALVSYFSILYFLKSQYATLNKEHSTNLIPKNTPTLRPVFIRTLAVCSIFFFFVIPASILIMVEATTTIPPFLSLAISICLALDALANPCLVLFAHSVIYSRLKLYIRRLSQTTSDASPQCSYPSP